MGGATGQIRRELEELADPAYRGSQAKLVPTVDPTRILGVRTPALRALAKKLARERPLDARTFLETLPHATCDEMNLHGELIGLMAKAPEETFGLLDAFLPHVDNWAICDLIRVPSFRRDLPATLERIRGWIASEPKYAVRFGVVQLTALFLGDAFEPSQLDPVAKIARPEYYVNMAHARYFSFALIKQPATTLPYFERRPPAFDA